MQGGETAPETEYRVWLGDEARIVSFHPVEGYREQAFLSHEFFLKYLQGLQCEGWRFQ